jgi:hypothetical protein
MLLSCQCVATGRWFSPGTHEDVLAYIHEFTLKPYYNSTRRSIYTSQIPYYLLLPFVVRLLGKHVNNNMKQQ